MLGIGRGESYVIKQSGLWIQRDHTLDQESVLLADGVKGRVLIKAGGKVQWHTIWHDMVWYDMIWHDMIWHLMTWYDTYWHDMRWDDIIWPIMKMTVNDMNAMNGMIWPIRKVALNDSQRHNRGTYLFLKYYFSAICMATRHVYRHAPLPNSPRMHA
jgi:hypothetical protein